MRIKAIKTQKSIYDSITVIIFGVKLPNVPVYYSITVWLSTVKTVFISNTVQLCEWLDFFFVYNSL